MTNILRAACLAGTIFSLSIVPSEAQSQSQEVKKEPVQATSPNSGSEMFHSYCAPCHGANGKGNGPAAGSLKNPPANVTQPFSRRRPLVPPDSPRDTADRLSKTRPTSIRKQLQLSAPKKRLSSYRCETDNRSATPAPEDPMRLLRDSE